MINHPQNTNNKNHSQSENTQHIHKIKEVEIKTNSPYEIMETFGKDNGNMLRAFGHPGAKEEQQWSTNARNNTSDISETVSAFFGNKSALDLYASAFGKPPKSVQQKMASLSAGNVSNTKDNSSTGKDTTSSSSCVTTPVQAVAIPVIQHNHDLLVRAPTGMGKTYTYLYPILTGILGNMGRSGITCVILVPARELAVQVKDAADKLISAFGGASMYSRRSIRVSTVYGQKKIDDLTKSNIIVACPGKLLDMINSNRINLKSTTHFVLDEADRMLEFGFIDSIRAIYTHIKSISTPSVSLFSATYNTNTQVLISHILTNYIYVEVQNEVIDTITQKFIKTGDKLRSLIGILDTCAFYSNWLKCKESDKVLIFVERKRDVEALCNKLRNSGNTNGSNEYTVEMLHGDMPQPNREMNLSKFRTNTCNILVATSVAARGIDVKDLKAVINYDMPRDTKEYIHRIGRTGREGKSGVAYSLYNNIREYDTEYIRELVEILKEGKNEIPTEFAEYINTRKNIRGSSNNKRGSSNKRGNTRDNNSSRDTNSSRDNLRDANSFGASASNFSNTLPPLGRNINAPVSNSKKTTVKQNTEKLHSRKDEDGFKEKEDSDGDMIQYNW